MHVTSAVGLSALLTLAGVSCYDTITVGDLPKEIATQLNDLQTQFIFDPKGGCGRLQAVEVKFLVYTRNNPDDPKVLDENTIIKKTDSTKKVVLLIHGWLSSPHSSGISQLKDAYLKRYDCKVIVVDWSQMAWKLYTTAYCHVLKIANYVAKFLCESDSPLNEVHVVGHSMGAQIAGIVGQFVNTKCKQQIGRITGLDPSGPLFQTAPIQRRLDPTDAKFVDVIHTDQLKMGFAGNCGHVDFHPNCGQLQPGCPSISNITNSTLLADVFCSHHRSLEYMVESIMSDHFVGSSCGMCPRYCRSDIISEVHSVMGEDCRPVPGSSNKFHLHTKSSPPYAQGWALSNAKLP